jgi:hypothetical protein
MMSWIAMARRTDSRRRRDRLVVGVRVQAVGVVVDGGERLQRRADVVERDLLRVQAPARRLPVELELLAALVRAVLVAHRHRPDARATRPITEYSGSMPNEKKNERFGAKSSIAMPRARYASTKVKPLASVKASWLIGFAPASAMWYPEMETE